MRYATETTARPLLETSKLLTGASRGFVAILNRATDRVVVIADGEHGAWESAIEQEIELAHACSNESSQGPRSDHVNNAVAWMPQKLRKLEGISDYLVVRVQLEDAPECLLCVFDKALGFSPEDEDALNSFAAMVSRTIPMRRSLAPSGIDATHRVNALLAQTDRLAGLGSLSAGVAHEINNHLSYVLFNVETLAEGLPELAQSLERAVLTLSEYVGEQQAARLISETGLAKALEILGDLGLPAAEALQGTHRVRKLVRDLNTYSRADSGRITTVSLNSVLDTVVEMTKNQCKYRAKVQRDYGDIPPMSANEAGLRQVFLNLLVNAAQAIEEGHVEDNLVKITSRVEGAQILVQISDTGKGIDRSSFAHIFDPFFTTKNTDVDSGLGLWVCRNIVGNYGGSIEVTSEPGRGSCFTVHLPLRPSVQAEHESSPAASDTCRSKPNPSSVLIVDDEPMIGAMLRRLLSREHAVTVAESGAQARTLFEQGKHFDLILCDLIMPDVSGMELHAWLAKSQPQLARHMIFMTAGSFTQKSREFLETTQNTYVEKPFDSSAVLAVVREHLTLQRHPQTRAG